MSGLIFFLIFPLLIICNICKICFIQMCDLTWVREYLTNEAGIQAENALVRNRFDYCNSLQKSVEFQHAQTAVYLKHTY